MKNGWMNVYDCHEAGVPYEDPKPADVSDLRAENAKLRHKITGLEQRFKHFTEQVNTERDGYARAYEMDKEAIENLLAETEHMSDTLGNQSVIIMELEAENKKLRAALVAVRDGCFADAVYCEEIAEEALEASE